MSNESADTRAVPEWVKDFLDHMRETCLEDRQRFKQEARKYERRWRASEQKVAELERYLAARFDGEEDRG